MCTIMKTYGRFAGLLDGSRILENPFVRFRDVCRFLRVSPASLDEILMDELGMTGAELMESRRKSLRGSESGCR